MPAREESADPNAKWGQGRVVEDSVGEAVTRVYELQLVALGMILAKPSRLDEYESGSFCDAEIHCLISDLKSPMNAQDKRRRVESFLVDRGVEPYIQRGLDAAAGVRERVVVDSKYCKALSYVITLVNNSGSVSSKDKLDFIETLKVAGEAVS